MINLMSFNIRYGTADDGDNHWERRRSLVIDRIKDFDPDLLGLQECRDDSQADYIRSTLQQYEFFGVPRGGDSSTALEMAPILLKKTLFQLIRQGVFWLSKTPHVAGSKSWDSVFPRTATWAELFHRPSGQSLLFLNTHFDYRPSAIQQSAGLLRQWINEAVTSHPLVVTGDFNANKSSTAYQLLTSHSPVQDVLRAVWIDREDEGTYHGYGMESQPIDWILASHHFDVIHASIDRYQNGQLFPSDHYPIMASLDWTL